jgi:hypothetical protein
MLSYEVPSHPSLLLRWEFMRYSGERIVIRLHLLALSALVVLPLGSHTTWTVMLRRVGPVRFGMSVGEAGRAAGGRLEGVRGTGCEYTRTPDTPAGLRLMVEEGRVVRADVDSAGIRTGSGAEVGLTEEEVQRLYPGRITRQPHKYVREGFYLIFTPRDPADRDYRLIFETDGRVVTRYRAGLRPAVEYVEGCS